MARLRKYGFAFAVAGALAIAAGAASAQVVDPFEERPVSDDDDVFEDAVIKRRGLRGILEPGQENVFGGDAQNRRQAGSQSGVAPGQEATTQNAGNTDAAGRELFREPPSPFSEPPDPLRDPLADADLAAGLGVPGEGDAVDAGRNADGAEEDPYAALGVRMGSFLLFPEISVESLYDDNLFLSSTNEKGDWAVVLTPSLRAESDWSRHSLVATLSAVRSYHDEFASEDDETYSAGVTGRLDIRRTTNIVAEANYSQSLEDRSSTDFPSGASGRAKTRNQDVSLEGNHSFNRVTVTLRGEIAEEDFDDGTADDGTLINNDDRDFTERRVTARVSYEFQPDVAFFVEASVNERDFAESFDDDGTRNGSSGRDVQAGLSFQLTGKLTGEISAGYALQTPDDPALLDVDGLIFNAGLEWLATGLTTLRLDASSQVDETTQAGSAGSIVRSAAVSIEHRPRRHITLGASLGYEREEFSASDTVDEDLVFALTGEYNFTRSAALIAAYSYLDSTSSTPDSDYSVNQMRLGVRLRR